MSCCFCSEGLRLQVELINHMFTHFAVKNEIDCITVDNEPSQIIEFDDSLKTTRRRNTKTSTKIKDKNSLNCEKIESFTQPGNTTSSSVQCEFCPKVFKYKQGAKKHWDLEHNPENSFPCTKASCLSRCKTLKNLHAHLRTHEPPKDEGLKELQCQKCLKNFSTRKQLTLHLYTHREKFFSCDTCGSKFNNRQQIKKHVMRHVGLFHQKINYQRIICDQCSMMVYTHKMKRHKLIHHSSEKPFKCDFPGCSGSFSDKRMLKDHKNIHLKLKPYVCEFCSESFRSGANLRQHRLRHTDPEKYRCEECQASFVTKQSLQKHNRRHTEDPEIRPYACDYQGCSSTFKQKDHVRNHIRRIHEKTEEVFNCGVSNQYLKLISLSSFDFF